MVLKIPKLKRTNIPLVYLIVFLILFIVSFFTAYIYHYDVPDSSFDRETHVAGGYFTDFSLFFYFIGVILIYCKRVTASIVPTAIGNALLSLNLIGFVVEVSNLTKGEGYAIGLGFYIIVFLWIVLIIINILMFVFKADLGDRTLPDQPVNN